MWEDGWKQRYYKTKFDVDATDEDFKRKVVRSYVEGLCWVLRYYYQVQNTPKAFLHTRAHPRDEPAVLKSFCVAHR